MATHVRTIKIKLILQQKHPSIRLQKKKKLHLINLDNEVGKRE